MKKAILATIALSSTLLLASEFNEIRELSLDTSNKQSFTVKTTSGYLKIIGRDDLDQIQVKATIRVETGMTFDEDDAKEYLSDNLTLELTDNGSGAELMVKFEDNSWFNNRSRAVDLDILVPSNLELKVHDGSGSLSIVGMTNGLDLKDGSGSATVKNIAGNVQIVDGSGSLTIEGIRGQLEIEDGSGSMSISNVTGDIVIDDGSGSISIDDVRGSVRVDDGSGSINASNVTANFIVEDDGSGSVSVSNIGGEYVNHDKRHKRKSKDLM
jgi:hypothetical protein